MSANLLRQWIAQPTTQALRIVNNILASNPKPLSTKEIYKLALEHKPDNNTQLVHGHQSRLESVHESGKQRQAPPQPPNPEHPIRSVRYLKKVVLPALHAQHKVEKIHMKRTLDTSEIQQRLNTMTKAGRKAHAVSLAAPIDSWLWRVSAVRPAAQPSEQRGRGEVMTEVGIGEDWSHLNKRRRRARVRKVARDVAIVRLYGKREREGDQLRVKMENQAAR